MARRGGQPAKDQLEPQLCAAQLSTHNDDIARTRARARDGETRANLPENGDVDGHHRM